MQLPDMILDWFFPRRCVLCTCEGAWACEECLIQTAAKIDGVDSWLPSEALSTTALLPYEQPLVKELLHNLKYNGISEVVISFRVLLEKIYSPVAFRLQLQEQLGCDELVLIPVPTSRSRLRQRGYNQAEILARMVGEWLEIPVWSEALRRSSGESQVGKSAEERQLNLTEAFTWNGSEKFQGSGWLLFDDLATTGATLRACSTALQEQLPVRLGVLTLARKH